LPEDPGAEWLLKIGPPETAFTLAVSLNRKAARKTIASARALGDKVIVLLQGRIVGNDGILHNPGLTVTQRRPVYEARSSQAPDEQGVPSVVKFYKPEGRFGFLRRSDGKEGEAFFHGSIMEAAGVEMLKSGTAVEADLRQTAKGMVAVAIRLPAAAAAAAE
jgi:cold shock CspA family protein